MNFPDKQEFWAFCDQVEANKFCNNLKQSFKRPKLKPSKPVVGCPVAMSTPVKGKKGVYNVSYVCVCGRHTILVQRNRQQGHKE